MLAAVQAREAALLSAQHVVAAHRHGRGGGLPLRAGGDASAVLIDAGANPAARRARRSWWWRRSRRSAACRAAGASRATRRGGTAGAGGRGRAAVPVPEPASAARCRSGRRCAFEAVRVPLAARPAAVFDGLTLEIAARCARGAARPVRRRQVDAGGAGAEGGGASIGPGSCWAASISRRSPRPRCAPRIGWLSQTDASVRRHDPRQPAAGAAGCRRGRAVGGARCRAHRRGGAGLARSARHLGRRGRHAVLRRPGAAAGAGAHAAVAGAGADPGRAVRRARRGNRARVPGDAERDRGRAHVDADRAPADRGRARWTASGGWLRERPSRRRRRSSRRRAIDARCKAGGRSVGLASQHWRNRPCAV